MSPASVTWKCPVCGRRVPRRVTTCFCGARQADVVQHERREAARTAHRIPADVAALLALAVLVGVYGVHRLTRHQEPSAFEQGARQLGVVLPRETARAGPPPQSAPAPVAPPPTAAPQPVAPAPATRPPAPVETPPPLAPPATAAAAAAAAPPSHDPMEQTRLAGLRAYAGELQRLAPLATRMSAYVDVFRKQCVGGPRFAGGVSNCDEIESTIRKIAGEIETGLNAAEDQARRAWVEPGAIRDVRAKSFFGTRDWDELQRTASDPRRP